MSIEVTHDEIVVDNGKVETHTTFWDEVVQVETHEYGTDEGSTTVIGIPRHDFKAYLLACLHEMMD